MNSSRSEKDERQLIEAAKQDPSLFADLYEDNFERVYAFIARRVPHRQDVQDLTSEVFHHALANLARFEWRGAPFAAWLFRIASNAVADYFERIAKQRKLPEPQDPTDPGPQEIEESAYLFRLVETLPEDQRRVILLRFAEQKSIREIAGDLGRSEGAVKQLQFRALQNLRTRMGQKNG